MASVSPYAHASERRAVEARAEAARRKHEEGYWREQLRSQRAREDTLEADRREQAARASQQRIFDDPNALDAVLRGHFMAKHKGADASSLMAMGGGAGWA